jgi:hypothetical protein
MKTATDICHEWIGFWQPRVGYNAPPNIISAMEEYAKIYHESEVNKLSKDDVSGRSELLKKFWEYFDKESVAVNCNDEERNEVIKDFFNSH